MTPDDLEVCQVYLTPTGARCIWVPAKVVKGENLNRHFTFRYIGRWQAERKDGLTLSAAGLKILRPMGEPP